jgi:hypothetical protein
MYCIFCVCICSLNYPACKAHAPYYIIVCGLSGCRLCLKCDGTRAETRFRLSAKRTSSFKSAGGVSSVDYWQASCAHQPAGFVLLVRVCILQSCAAYWLLTSFSCFPFTSPPVRHRVPSHFKRSLPYSPTLSRNRHDFRDNVTEHEMRVFTL